MKEEISILIHGYNKNKNDMSTLAKNLEKLNYKCILVDLPLTYKEIDYAAFLFQEIIEKILKGINQNEKVNLIGHSAGGLIIRKYLLETKNIERIKSCVLIATPNSGSELADMAANYFKAFTHIFKTLKSLKTENAKMINFINDERIRIGAIAGKNDKLLLGKLLTEENDGRVTVKSVYYEGLEDFIILPYHHKEIHYKWKTAELVDDFIQTGRFVSEL
ncbi:alpha/beta fold hydrolase [Clostridium magnum]|uniref:2-succinyl-6-hydroxy-2, 4-cyclohexadiene-1-carboxylate synthase n=1 Tax=Clostridium magnum DSM 2767 TaxID=1121326 RepID=A0A162QXV5_9CLOT|nr:alpha/beta fold hydrolase [Clostridium magnum]KZL89124.1 2-succinyl-6-hydroxy-2,4-cyclohexadiene-1-carboxylate synthase [Clostridium magnum DSM 2767]SHI03324.1 Alpha/beta hydrolase family protein [Clostridium magnum DSM 2767]